MTALLIRRILPTAIALLGLSAALLITAGPAAAAPTPTVVTLTYDDGVADVFQAGQLMAERGMHGTFYLKSGAIGASQYLTRDQVDALHEAGHEIGGHTAGHVDLTTLSPDEARRQLCQDRNTLTSWGYPVTSFAYPFGATNEDVRTYVAECGYNSARQVGDIVSTEGCEDCSTSETVPPVDPYYTRAPSSVRSTWSLTDLQTLVTQAQDDEGGWVQVVFHHICDGCNIYGVAPDTFTAFLDWLQDQQESGAVVVRTVDEVIGGTVRDPVAPPDPRDPAGYGVNGLINPGLEASGDGTLPDCWQLGGYGTQEYTTARTSDAHNGDWAQYLSVTSGSQGDRKLISQLDLGECSPSVIPGHRYQASAWYRADRAPVFVAYYRNAAGGWSYWTTGPSAPVSADWAQASWTMPAIPEQATAVAFGLALTGVGSGTFDDYALIDIAPDTTAPTAALTTPVDGATLTGTVALTANAGDDVGVTRVDFAVDETTIGSATDAPYQFFWSSSQVANGQHTISATAHDAAGHTSVPSSITVTTANQAVNLVRNPSLEDGTGSVPECWQRGSAGTNTGSVEITDQAHTGSRAERVTITERTSGDRKLVVSLDSGTCAPTGVPGQRYQVSSWYRSTSPVPFVVFYRTTAGAWKYWATSPSLAASSEWTQGSWTTPALPADATALSFGLALTSVGTLTTDDYALVVTG